VCGYSFATLLFYWCLDVGQHTLSDWVALVSLLREVVCVLREAVCGGFMGSNVVIQGFIFYASLLHGCGALVLGIVVRCWPSPKFPSAQLWTWWTWGFRTPMGFFEVKSSFLWIFLAFSLVYLQLFLTPLWFLQQVSMVGFADEVLQRVEVFNTDATLFV